MPCASCCGSQADERSSFAEPSCRAHGLCSDHGWRPAAVQNAGAAGGWRWSARRADRRLSAQRVFFSAALTVLWVWILSFTQLSRTYPFLALAFASRQRLVASFLPNRCDTARDRHRADLVGFSSLGGERWPRRRREYALSSPLTMRRR